MSETVHSVIIIGGGPSGLSAALYNARAGLSPILFAGSPPGGQLMLTSEVENFPGYPSILGADLVEILRKQSTQFGTKIIDENITNVDFSRSPFSVTYSGGILRSKTVLISTGAKALWLGIDSEQRLRGKGVSACATCDGFFFKNRNVAVVGGGDTALEEAQTLTRFASSVTLIHRRDSFRASKIMQERIFSNPKIKVMWNTEILEVLGDSKVEGLKIRTKPQVESDLKIDGLFIAIGHKPDTSLFEGKILLDKKGYILTQSQVAERLYVDASLENNEIEGMRKRPFLRSETSVPGVFAAGDCVDYFYRQASTASGMGVAAALDIEHYLDSN